MYRKAANGVTIGRTVAAGIFAANTLSGDRLLPKQFRHKSIGLAAGTAVIAACDKLDGVLGRLSEANGVPITDRDKKLDSDLDKWVTYMAVGSVAGREIIGGLFGPDQTWQRRATRVGFGALAIYNLDLKHDRNERMRISRENAVEGANIGAIFPNQVKTGMEFVFSTISSSPLLDTDDGMYLATAILNASTWLGEHGFTIAHRRHQGLE